MNMAIVTDDMELSQLGAVLAKSGYFADARDAAQAIVKVLAGRELGFGPIASMTGIFIVKGRVTLSANLVAAAIQRSRYYHYAVRQLDDRACTLAFFDAHRRELGVSTFTAEDAARAGLMQGEGYKHFPRNMFFARALTNGARWYCPEVFNGPVYTPDELVDEVASFPELPMATVPEEPEPQPNPIEPIDQPNPREMVRWSGDPMWRRWQELTTQAAELDLPQAREAAKVTLPLSRQVLIAYGTQLGRAIDERRAELAEAAPMEGD